MKVSKFKTTSSLSTISFLFALSLGLYLQLGIAKDRSNKAAPQPTQCEKLPNENRKQLWEVANCFFKANNYDKAIKTLRDISTQNPKELDAFFVASFNIWQKASLLAGNQKDLLIEEALEELNRASVLNPTHWRVYLEIGDFYYLRLKKPEKAYKYYQLAHQHYNGDKEKDVPEADNGQKSSIENRLARTNEALDRNGEAVTASCLSLHWDPDSTEALERLKRLSGSCKRKDFRSQILPSASKNTQDKTKKEEK